MICDFPLLFFNIFNISRWLFSFSPCCIFIFCSPPTMLPPTLSSYSMEQRSLTAKEMS